MALEVGINVNSFERIAAGIRYALILASYNGNTCVEKQNLFDFVTSKLDVETKYVEEVLINLKSIGKIEIEEIEETEWVFLQEFSRVESNITQRLYMMLKTKNMKFLKSFESDLDKEESFLDINLSEKQKEALKQVNESNVSIITGGPGTRKNNNYKSFN